MDTYERSTAARRDRMVAGSLIALALQDVLLMAALFAQVEPHPPASVGPLIGATLVLSLRAAWNLQQPGRWTYPLALVAALVHLPSFGPHKFLLSQAPVIWPMVLLGLVLQVQVVWLSMRGWLGAVGARRAAA